MVNFNFTATCEPTNLRTCQPGTNFMDPCDCKKYYQCTNIFSMSNMTCNEGTLWDYTLGICNHDINVQLQSCSSMNSWERCNTTASRLNFLKVLCTGIDPNTTTTPSITAKPPEVAQSTDSGVNPGMVAGLVLAGAVMVLAIIALYVLYTRRKKLKEKKLKRRTTAENREYFENGVLEDPYAIIDDRMVDPVYSPNNNSDRNNSNLNGTIPTTSTTLPTAISADDTTVDYDNSAFRDDGYTSTLNRTLASQYDTLTGSARSRDNQGPITNHDISVEGLRNGTDSDKGNGEIKDNDGRDVSDEASGMESNEDTQSPDYYKLQALS